VVAAGPRLGDDLRRDQQCDLDPDTGEADRVAADLGAGGDVVIPGQLAPTHAAAVVDDGEGSRCRVGRQRDRAGLGIERVCDDVSEDRFLARARVGVAEIFEKVKEIDACLTHRGRDRRTARRSDPDCAGLRSR
jgi:hypothetical protein